MQETAEQYINRLTGYVQGRDPVEVLSETIPRLEQSLQENGPSIFEKKIAGKWMVPDILAHFAEGEIVLAYRIRMILSANGCPIQAYEPDIWVQNATYLKSNPQIAFDLFRSVRLSNIAFLKSLDRNQWECYGMHSERGKESIRQLVTLLAGHDINHMAQIEKIIASP